VENFWMLYNPTKIDNEVIILPDGNIDLFFSESINDSFHTTLLGIGTQAEKTSIKKRRKTFAISFKPFVTEYLFDDNLSSLLNKAHNLPTDFWGFSSTDLVDFELFCQKATAKILSLVPNEIDRRKQKLFELIYASNGTISVSELSDKVVWSSRQINRYFNSQFGLSLKVYCNIIRFRASFNQIKEGKLFPEKNFYDQPHFIREVKKFTGVNPKILNKNQNDRFIQFSTLPKT